MSKLRLVVLESDDADGHAIGAIVGVLREMQIGRLQPQVTSASVETFVEGLREELAPPVLSAPKARKARKAAAPSGEKKSRVGNAGAIVLDAIRKNKRPDLAKLAVSLYGDAGRTQRVKHVLNYLARAGKVNDHKDGSYTVVG